MSAEKAQKLLPKNYFSWGLALCPLVILIINFILLVSNVYSDAVLSVSALVSYGFTIWLWLLDRRELEKCGLKIGTWKYWILVLPVVYLFIRAYKTDKKYGSAIVDLIFVICQVFFILTLVVLIAALKALT